MGGKFSLPEIEKDFVSFLKKLELRRSRLHTDQFDPRTFSNHYDDYYEKNTFPVYFHLGFLYSGNIDDAFAETMPKLILEYLEKNPKVHPQIIILCRAVILALMKDYIITARLLAAKINDYPTVYTAAWYQDMLPQIKDDELFYLVSKRKKMVCHIKQSNYRGLTFCENIDDVLAYENLAENLFTDSYIEQFKLLFYHNKRDPCYLVNSSAINKHNVKCTLWLLETFEYSEEELRKTLCLYSREHEIQMYLLGRLAPKTEQLLEWFWKYESLREPIIILVNMETIMKAADTPSKRNILHLNYQTQLPPTYAEVS